MAQQLLDQPTGADSILHHLSKDPTQRLRQVQRYGACCHKCDGDRYRDTVLPWALDTERPLPPLLRLNKLILSEGIRDISDTLTVSQPGTPVPVTYQLLAVVYGSGAHFTCDVRYAIDAGDSQFFHYDPFHFRQDRLLRLSDKKPACQGGVPVFLDRHTPG